MVCNKLNIHEDLLIPYLQDHITNLVDNFFKSIMTTGI